MKRPPVRQRRRYQPRRQHDRYMVILQRVVLGTGAIGVIWGQAEMLGEPMRHVVTVFCVFVLVVVAVWMKQT